MQTGRLGKHTGIDETADGNRRGRKWIWGRWYKQTKNILTGIPEDRKGMGSETLTDSKPGGDGDRKGAGNWQ